MGLTLLGRAHVERSNRNGPDSKIAHPILEPKQSLAMTNLRRTILPLQAGEGRVRESLSDGNVLSVYAKAALTLPNLAHASPIFVPF